MITLETKKQTPTLNKLYGLHAVCVRQEQYAKIKELKRKTRWPLTDLVGKAIDFYCEHVTLSATAQRK